MSLDETIDLPVGTIEGAIHRTGTAGGRYITGDTDDGRTVSAELWLHPEHRCSASSNHPVLR